jgi:hypothetical protein
MCRATLCGAHAWANALESVQEALDASALPYPGIGKRLKKLISITYLVDPYSMLSVIRDLEH